MQTGHPDFLDRLAQVLVALAALVALANGLFMLAAPLDWYVALPTVITTGPPNQHFIRDIGLAYCASGIMLGYAAWNLPLRWLAALAGNLWLLLHGVLHIYEVSVGICAPGVFWADAPGVLGPPMLVLVAVGLQMGRQRIAPAGIPKSVFLEFATAKVDDSEAQYLREIAAAPGDAFAKFAHFMPASLHRYDCSPELFHAARMGVTLVEDCGPCALTSARWAQVDGVADATINRWFTGPEGLPEDESLAFRFGQAIGRQSPEAFALGDEIEAKFGRTVRFELAMTTAIVRSYPGMKRGLGLTKACSLTPLSI